MSEHKFLLTTADGLSAPAAGPAGGEIGPLEQKHLQYANYRAVADGTEVSKTHWHIALANALGWGFDGMDGVIFALISPMVIKEFSLTVPEYRSGLQIALFIGIAGLYFWPWLSDRLGRRTLLAVNIALFSLLMPVAALSPTFTIFVIARSALGFALNGEWSLGSMLVAETWPARLRGRVISINASDLVPRRLARRRHHGARRRRFRLARCGHGAGRDRAACDLCPRHLPGIALLGARAGPQAAHLGNPGARRHRQRRRQRLVRQGESRSASARCSCPMCCPPRWSRCSWPAAAPASSARSAAGCRSISRPRSTGRRPNTACSTCSGAFPVSSAFASRAGSPTGSAAGSPSW